MPRFPRTHFAAILAITSVALPVLANEPGVPATQAPAMNHPKVCLVLSGGGARGVAHIGVLKVLEELHVPVHCIVGTSMGAIIGGAYAYGMTPAQLEKQMRETLWESVLLDQPAREARSVRDKELDRDQLGGAEFGIRGREVLLPAGAIIGHQLEIFLQGLAGPNEPFPSFDTLPIPFRALATDIEHGSLYVIDHGSLPAALRASMSVPGLFAPAELDGKLLADGGLVRNLGVDVAREFNPDVLIAVSLGTGLMQRDELRSVFGVGTQMINILTEQNVRISLRELKPTDVLILPELGDFSSADFANSYKTIEVGERAARALSERLEALAVSEEEYASYIARLRVPRASAPFDRVRLDTAALERVNPQVVEATFHEATGDDLSDASIARGLTALLATDDFQQVRYRVDSEGGARQLTVEPREKSWGPNYLRFGMDLSTDFDGESSFTLLGDHRMTWLNSRGLEWRNRVALGDLTGIVSELYQPLDLAREWFVAPRGFAFQQLDSIFIGEDSVSEYRNRRGGIGVDLGRRFGTLGELRVGYDYGAVSFRTATGVQVFDREYDHVGSLGARLLIDQFDHWDFPTKGYLLRAEARASRPELGADLDYDTGVFQLEKAFGSDRNRYRAGLVYTSSFDTERPIHDAFALGGFLRLSGYADREILTDGALLGRFVYERKIAHLAPVSRGLFVAASIEAADIEERLNGPQVSSVLWSGALFLAADTILGPLYVGAGFAESGNGAAYLFLGRP
ncbi:MAG TPA: patatin-like phospholipase family protein [Steroidobacteraceae bacterium]|nr:patatin-like phospholipase family protein [Steroidobacteraceae bacterium]